MTGKTNTAEIGSFMQKSTGPNEGVSAVNAFFRGESEGSIMGTEPPKKESSQKEEDLEKKQKTVEEMSDELTKLKADIEKVKEAPELTYEQRLKKVDVTLPEAEAIIDALMVEGEFRKTYQLTSKYSVTFKSRKMQDQNRALNVIEAQGPQYPSTVGNIVTECNLAASIVKFRNIDFKDEMEIKDRLTWVKNLPETVATVLSSKLSKFDQMLLTVLEEGAIENF